MKKKAMISQPMRGYDAEEIAVRRGRAMRFLEAQGYDFVNTLFTEARITPDVTQAPVYFLSESIKKMSLCDTVYFCKGWEDARGCRIEHAVAEAYGLEILYEE